MLTHLHQNCALLISARILGGTLEKLVLPEKPSPALEGFSQVNILISL